MRTIIAVGILLGLPQIVAAQPIEINDLEIIGFQQLDEVSRVFVETTEPVRYKLAPGKARELILTLANTTITRPVNALPLDMKYFDSPVRYVKAEAIEGASPSVQVRILLRREAGISRQQSDNRIQLDFRR